MTNTPKITRYRPICEYDDVGTPYVDMIEIVSDDGFVKYEDHKKAIQTAVGATLKAAAKACSERAQACKRYSTMDVADACAADILSIDLSAIVEPLTQEQEVRHSDDMNDIVLRGIDRDGDAEYAASDVLVEIDLKAVQAAEQKVQGYVSPDGYSISRNHDGEALLLKDGNVIESVKNLLKHASAPSDRDKVDASLYRHLKTMLKIRPTGRKIMRTLDKRPTVFMGRHEISNEVEVHPSYLKEYEIYAVATLDENAIANIDIAVEVALAAQEKANASKE